MGVVNYMCGVRELQYREAKQNKSYLVKGQLTLFGERASSDTDNLGKS